MPHKKTGWVLRGADGLCAIVLLLVPLIWFFDPLVFRLGDMRWAISWGFTPVAVLLVLLAVRWAFRRQAAQPLPSSRLLRTVCLAVLPSFLLLLGLEGVARLAGIKPASGAPIIVMGKEAPLETAGRNMRGDPELLYEFEPHARWEGMTINSHGFRTWEFSAEKPAGAIRVICLGDSCTAQGQPPYSDRLNDRLQAAPPAGKQWEAFNMGVHGYSILQGLRQFQRYGPMYQPDVVTIFFGWNDHWLYSTPDRQRMGVRMNPVAGAITSGIRKKRLYAAVASLLPGAAAPGPQADQVLRVPLPEYREHLRELIRTIRAQGARPIVLTAPRTHLHPAVVKHQHARSVEEAEQLHDAYAQATRDVAAEEAADLLDLARLFENARPEKAFMGDGIHFRSAGLDFIVDALEQHLRE